MKVVLSEVVDALQACLLSVWEVLTDLVDDSWAVIDIGGVVEN
jgi:hypothetical protein